MVAGCLAIKRCSFWISIFLIIFTLANEASSGEIYVAAASSLQFVFREAGRAFQAEKGHKVTFSFGATGLLTEQIFFGAPFDVFASASPDYMERLETEDLVEDSTDFALGSIVIATKKEFELNNIAYLLSPKVKRIAIANPRHAPYGAASKEALQKKGLWDEVQDKIIFAENIMQILQFLQTGNVDAAILALSLADVSGIKYSAIDEGLYSPIIQSMAIVESSRNKKVSREFINFLTGSKGSLLLRKFGFKEIR